MPLDLQSPRGRKTLMTRREQTIVDSLAQLHRRTAELPAIQSPRAGDNTTNRQFNSNNAIE
eukprot:210204-Amphidinium_carterae.1